jgi:hypothetical protein
MLGSRETTRTSDTRLVIHSESFDHPPRLVPVRKKCRVSSEQSSAKTPDTVGAIEMKDVNELVSYDEPAPVIVVAELRRSDGRVRKNDDAIIWKWRRVAVHEIDIVGYDEVDLSLRSTELGAYLSPRSLSVDRAAAPLRLEPLREVNTEMRCLDRQPAIVRNELTGRARREKQRARSRYG